MRRGTVVVPLAILLFFLFAAVSTSGQQQARVKVRGMDIATGVVIVDIVKDGHNYELRCNQGAYQCQPLKNGNYLMIELPENFGMYECRNVEIYAGDLARGEKLEKMGEYCLIEK